MPKDATWARGGVGRQRAVARIALATVAIGVFLTWTSDGPVDLNGIQGPNDGWLVLILAAFALGWARALERGSWVGVVGALGSALVMAWTALDSWLDARELSDASPGLGLVLVVGGSAVLAALAVRVAVELIRSARASGP